MKNIFLSLPFLFATISASATNLRWTSSSDSVQAVVYEALYNLKQADESSQNPQGLVKSGNGAELIVEDSESKLVCNSKSGGVTTVQKYSCKITVKK